MYAELLPPQRRRLHQRIADTFREQRPQLLSRADRSSELAVHLDRAGDHRGAFTALLAAADASETVAPGAALRHLERAFELWDEATQVLVEVHAAGVDRGVAHLVTGTPYLIRLAGCGITKPKHPVPGADVAGRVVAVGDEVTRFRPGDEVFGIATGTCAEYAAADEHKLVHKPANITFEQAGVAAISGGTALQALTDVGRLEAGQRVLVVGASDGVGSYAVQLAKAFGGVVIGVASAAKVDMVRSIGADDVIDYTAQDYLDGTTRHDLIIDIGGPNSIPRLRRALTATGTLVLTGGEGGGRWTGGFLERRLRAGCCRCSSGSASRGSSTRSTTRSSNASPSTSPAAPSCRSSIEPSTSNTFPTPSATSPRDGSPARRPSSSDPHETSRDDCRKPTNDATTTHRCVGRARDRRWLGCRGGSG